MYTAAETEDHINRKAIIIMMNKLEEAIIYATILHQGKTRKLDGTPYILHPLEVSQILATMTHDEEVITAGILHDIVEDTDGTLPEIEKRFGERVAELVASDSEEKKTGKTKKTGSTTWKRRKEDSLLVLKNSKDSGAKMLWLADKLANIRSLAGMYSEKGEAIWDEFDETDPEEQRWYYSSIAEILELQFNKTAAFKELIKHINFIWPGTFDSDKARFRKYKEVSVEGCKMIASGAKGEVYRYDDELIIKVFNNKNKYRDVEQEIALSRKAFIMGIPTAISFGIVAVGDRYGAMYELLDSETFSSLIARNPSNVDYYASLFADLARTIHGIHVTEEDGFPDAMLRLRKYVSGGIGKEDEALAGKVMKLLDTISSSDTLTHGDFHTNNVFLLNGEPLLIDLDRLSSGHPMIEISDLYYFYNILGEDDPAVIEDFMGFSYDTAKQFFEVFLRKYLGTEDKKKINAVKEKAAFICDVRMINKIHKKSDISAEERAIIDRNLARIAELADKLDTLDF